ncbi:MULTISPECIES: hypothetical protein [Streptomyces]|uniref:Uncharacterized protein n=2 Tax=Streptomyces TaxID=1883 RepID=A0ABU4JZ14_9ACTN|nr:hypothetical protein [Streptomyces roseolus]MDX2290736.1 hypothetical protein [Streptomyces roseolus]
MRALRPATGLVGDRDQIDGVGEVQHLRRRGRRRRRCTGGSTDVEALDLTADRLRRLQEVAAKMVDDARVRSDRHTAQADAGTVRPVGLDGQQAHCPQQPGPHRGREAGQ